jgi:hypothetical protein
MMYFWRECGRKLSIAIIYLGLFDLFLVERVSVVTVHLLERRILCVFVGHYLAEMAICSSPASIERGKLAE